MDKQTVPKMTTTPLKIGDNSVLAIPPSPGLETVESTTAHEQHKVIVVPDTNQKKEPSTTATMETISKKTEPNDLHMQHKAIVGKNTASNLVNPWTLSLGIAITICETAGSYWFTNAIL
ncbi:hypothetical protein EG68_06626 [Paragonimus skrjabini miyazakii]|uniref:Uncharacterized protein n=1 Tax=Paragonimus skrjabini miyazakii TaxID=59628 RepID=A0A8S9YU51_9TREM|nr:hypothetical protein EG68_06626 [Paragonimus skrjabini miyazakii]